MEIVPPERIVFSYGFESGQPIPIGASRVTITLEETAAGTLVKLRHELPSAEVRDEHVQGWRYQLAVFANVVAKEAHAGAGALADRYFACWGETDAGEAPRRARRDRQRGPELPRSLLLHLRDRRPERPHRREPALHARRRARAARGAAPVPGRRRSSTGWSQGPDGSERAKGTNVFELTHDGRIARATGFWG